MSFLNIDNKCQSKLSELKKTVNVSAQRYKSGIPDQVKIKLIYYHLPEIVKLNIQLDHPIITNWIKEYEKIITIKNFCN